MDRSSAGRRGRSGVGGGSSERGPAGGGSGGGHPVGERRQASGVQGLALIVPLLVLVSVGPVREGPAPGPSALPGSQARRASIEDLAWIAGHWRLERDGELLEETWAQPVGNSIVGVFQWLRDGEVWLYELLSITEEEDGIRFRFRHFSGVLVAWEDKDAPLEFRLTRLGEREAVFENPERDQPRRFIFRRPADDRLVVRLEGYEDGELQVDEFAYTAVDR